MNKNSRRTFDDWYAERGDEYNKQRRERYSKDPDMRRKAQDRARERRRQLAAERERERKLTPKTEWAVSEVADTLGRSPVTVRTWHRRGLIPEPARDEFGRRAYTKTQVAQMRRLIRLISRCGTDRKKYQEKLPKLIESIKEKWGPTA